MRSIRKQYRSMFIPTIGWTDVTGDMNVLWPFDNVGIGQRVLLFGMLCLLVTALMAAGVVGEWMITNVFALFG